MLLGSNARLDLSGNLEINIQKSSSFSGGYIWTRINSYGNSAISVGGDLIVNSDVENNFRFSQEGIQSGQVSGFDVYIAGNLVNKGNTNFIFSNYYSTVDGVVQSGTGILNLAATPIDVTGSAPVDSVKMTFGGIEGTGSILITNNTNQTSQAPEKHTTPHLYISHSQIPEQAPSKAHCSQQTTTPEN